MDELARSKNTPGTDAAFGTLARIAVESESDERYPNGTVIIPADAPDAAALVSTAIAEGKPITVVFPDGSDFVAKPPEATGLRLVVILALAWMLHRASKKRDRPTYVPAHWVAEFHAASNDREPEPVG